MARILNINHYAGSPRMGMECRPFYFAQHSYFQLLHQGTVDVPLDLVAPVKSSSGWQQDLALANCFAQAQTLYLHRNVRAQSLTVVPPLARAMFRWLSALPFLRTHNMFAVRKSARWHAG